MTVAHYGDNIISTDADFTHTVLEGHAHVEILPVDSGSNKPVDLPLLNKRKATFGNVTGTTIKY